MQFRRKFILVISILYSITGWAQQVSTLYFMENSPMRHSFNPAFQPMQEGYVAFSPIGYLSVWAGNNRMTMNDLIYNDDTGKTITALNREGGHIDQFLNVVQKTTLIDIDLNTSLVGVGVRYKGNGYIHVAVNQRINGCVALPHDLYDFCLNGGHNQTNNVLNSYDIHEAKFNVTSYTEFVGGYSHQLNEQWTIGGKAKFLLGQTYQGNTFDELSINANSMSWNLEGKGKMEIAAPLNMDAIGNEISFDTISGIQYQSIYSGQKWYDYLKPCGYGAAFDFGFTYRPHPQVQIAAAITDLGFICWKGVTYQMDADSLYCEFGSFNIQEYVDGDQILTDSLKNNISYRLNQLLKRFRAVKVGTQFTHMTTMRLNVGIDANFCKNILGLGILSRTRLYNGKLYEEVTLAGSVRPCRWVHGTLSYSLIENGKYSNIGAGLSIIPYDGINLTLAMDYIPTNYAYFNQNQSKYGIPYQTKGINVALGLTVVWGTNKQDKEKERTKVQEQSALAH